MSQAVLELLTAVAHRRVGKPEFGVGLGTHHWPVEAVLLDRKVVLVEGEDADRASGLQADGYRVVGVEDVETDLLAALLIGD